MDILTVLRAPFEDFYSPLLLQLDKRCFVECREDGYDLRCPFLALL